MIGTTVSHYRIEHRLGQGGMGVISNCLAEDVAGWARCPLASRFDCAVFSFQVGLAKPDPAIYVVSLVERVTGPHERGPKPTPG